MTQQPPPFGNYPPPGPYPPQPGYPAPQGYPQAGSPQAPGYQQMQPMQFTPQGKKPRKKWPWVLSGILCLVVVAGVTVAVASGGDSGHQDKAAAKTSAGPARRDILRKKPGTGPAETFGGIPMYNACAVLSDQVLASAGFESSSGFLVGGSRLGPDGDHPENGGVESDAGFCGGTVSPLGQPDAVIPSAPQVLLSVYHRTFTERESWSEALDPFQNKADLKMANGVAYVRPPAVSKDDVEVYFGDGGHGDGKGATNVFELQLSQFPHLPGGETTLAKLIDAVSKNIAAGPAPMPEYSYPAPYNLVAKPCDAFPADVFTTITGKPASGLQKDLFGSGEIQGSDFNVVDMRCDRSARNDIDATEMAQNITVNQTIYPTPELAGVHVKEQCDYEAKDSSPLASPIGAVSCGSSGDHSEEVMFQAGRMMVTMSLVGDGPTGPAALAKMVPGAQKVYAILNR